MDPILTGGLTLLGVVIASYFTYRASTRKTGSDAGMTMIDQHQEDIVSLRTRVAHLERTQRIQGDYVVQLRMHIADGRPPPPPAWPAGLIT